MYAFKSAIKSMYVADASLNSFVRSHLKHSQVFFPHNFIFLQSPKLRQLSVWWPHVTAITATFFYVRPSSISETFKICNTFSLFEIPQNYTSLKMKKVTILQEGSIFWVVGRHRSYVPHSWRICWHPPAVVACELFVHSGLHWLHSRNAANFRVKGTWVT